MDRALKCAYVSCESDQPAMKRCAGCRKACYCSKRCQTDDWIFHIFDCQLGKPISSVYHLARACRRDLVPVDPQTRQDYGFDKASMILGADAQSNLLGLYIGLINALEVPLKEVRKWQQEGRLAEGIKRAFETGLPPGARGGYYPWFLQHQHILDASVAVDMDQASRRAKSDLEGHRRKAWEAIGGSPEYLNQPDKICSTVAGWPIRKQECFSLYVLRAGHSHPSPSQRIWRTFGFVAASCQGEELDFARQYAKLLSRCDFLDLCDAYNTSSIPSLFERHELSMSKFPLFCDVMSGSPGSYKSVWALKQYVDILASDLAPSPSSSRSPAIDVDYGYANCKNNDERKLLDETYKRLFAETRADPLDLHEACITGTLFQYVGRFVKFAPLTAKFRRLLHNLYPLADPEATPA